MPHSSIHAVAALSCLLAVAACGGDDFVAGDPEPLDVEGEYLLSVTNGDNGCSFGSWQDGQSSAGVPLSITQSGAAVSATIGGLTGGLVDLWLGARTFEGDVDGKVISVALLGTRQQTLGDCNYTIDVTATATLDGDALQGVLEYTARTGGRPECAPLTGCVTEQAFAGSRPPE